MKKIAILAAGVAMTLAIAVPVFADKNYNDHQQADPAKVTVTNMGTSVTTLGVTVANSGLNYTTAAQSDKRDSHDQHDSRSQSVATEVTTGSAQALSESHTVVGYTDVGCGCSKNITVSSYGTHVFSVGATVANSGLNYTTGGKLTTGAAFASGILTAEVNTTLVK